MNLTTDQTRAALTLLHWTSPTLAKWSLLTFDDVSQALDGVEIRCLGGLQLGAVRAASEAAGVEFISESFGGPDVRLRKST